MKLVRFEKIKINPLVRKDFLSLLKMEGKIYPKELVQGQALLQDIEKGNGLEYSFMIFCKRKTNTKEEKVGYLVAVENKTDEGSPTIYLEDVAVLSEAQNQGIAWEMIKKLVGKLKTKAERGNKPVLWDMHLRETSRGLLEKHKKELEAMGAQIVKEVFLQGHYKNGEDTFYRMYEVSALK